MSAFDDAIAALLAHEGGLADDPKDPGGLTRWGISARSYPNRDIRNLTRDEAVAIYRRDFWDALHLDQLPAKLARAVFDTAVNQGQGAAAKLLQRALGVPDDGRIGPATLAALARSAPRSDDLLRDFFAWRAIRYAEVPREQWDRFKLGWMRRLLDEHKAAVNA
jgi:lysozyme family protein